MNQDQITTQNELNARFEKLHARLEKDLNKQVDSLIDKKFKLLESDISKTILNLSERHHRQLIKDVLENLNLQTSSKNMTNLNGDSFKPSNDQVFGIIAEQIKNILIKDVS